MDVKCTGNKVNDRCTYTCKSGYRRNGVASRNCQPNGQWSGSLPRCDSKMLLLVAFSTFERSLQFHHFII